MPRSDIFYQYEPLEDPRINIRLLTVFGDDFKAPLRSRLEEISLDDRPTYLALSYVWGRPTTKRNLQINDRIFKIQPTVFDALRRFRAEFGAFSIWIDAICINQDDLDERSAQVTVMRRIYESAKMVLVYLGETEKGRELKHLFDSVMKFLPRSGECRDSKIDWNSLNKYGLPDVLSSRWHQLVQFFSHPWFLRVWTFQESLVARRSTFVQGDCSINQVDLFALVHQMVNVHGLHHYVDRTPRMQLSPMHSAAQRCNAIAMAQSPIAVNLLPQFWIRQPLIMLLRENIGAKATDFRDHIFALLGVSKEAEEPSLQPDYKESVDDTYKRVGKYMAENGFLPLLLQCTPNNNPPDWPSWIPRWHEPGSHILGIERAMCMSSLFTAAGRSVQNFRWQPGHSLFGRGMVVDTIAHMGSRSLVVSSITQVGSPEDLYPRVLHGLIEAFSMFCPRHPYVTGEPKSAVLWRLSVCDQMHLSSLKAPKSFQQDLARFLSVAKEGVRYQYLEQGDAQLERLHLDIGMMLESMPELSLRVEEDPVYEENEFLTKSGAFLARHVRCVTTRGYIGQVFQDVEVGDKVALLQGCDIPLILRPAGNGAYTYITTCYIHGIMYGEAWSDEGTDTIRIV
ncbi:HET-domain-containing protein [Fusarium falciforme]|uniref:HET-domain-containing protein n=1 Tax=Fusarium falciforme TaxID=195108 RepID=UPI0022FFDFB8|nr:HET-domain-containing protein [Fusarium falciforme]WAO93335.1 HET-domain-containing protein [Fusarium falciforme]